MDYGRSIRIVGERSVGHLGTLDPIATGVLPLLTGKFTRKEQIAGQTVEQFRVTVPVDATGGNDFGVLDPTVIQSQIWDSGRDPALGTVFILAAIPLATPSGILGLTPTPTPSSTPAPAGAVPAGATGLLLGIGADNALDREVIDALVARAY